MKAFVFISSISLMLIWVLTSATSVPKGNYERIAPHHKIVNDGGYFNPQKFYNKQCTFCHNENSKIGPSMSHIKAAYLDTFPKKEIFVQKMTAFILNPNADNRLIIENLTKYKVMPPGMFFDAKKIQTVAEYIYNKVEIPLKLKKAIKKKNENQKKKKVIEAKIRLEKGIDVCKILNLKPVDFEFAKVSINPAMAKQLDNLSHFLKDNPTINIEIRNYTDSRGSAQRNLLLSNKRANAIKRYLIRHGISYKRIKAKGYGETNLLNHCKDGVKCTEEQHAQNRRTELIIW